MTYYRCPQKSMAHFKNCWTFVEMIHHTMASRLVAVSKQLIRIHTPIYILEPRQGIKILKVMYCPKTYEIILEAEKIDHTLHHDPPRTLPCPYNSL